MVEFAGENSDDSDESGDDYESNLSEDDEIFDDFSMNFRSEVNYNGSIALSVRCAAHTLQLTVNDVLKKPTMIKKIAKTRKLAKKLRTPNIATILKNMGLKQAKLDMPTRWSSCYDMLERLLELKSFCDEFQETHNECKLSKSSWEFIKEFIYAFSPVKV